MNYTNIVELKGKTLKSITINNKLDDEIVFETVGSERYKMSHRQDCCENVSIEDIVGDINDLIGNPLLEAEEASNSDENPREGYIDESYTWTFYKFSTIKGSVVIRWYGSSNGFYSESVYIEAI